MINQIPFIPVHLIILIFVSEIYVKCNTYAKTNNLKDQNVV